MDQLQVKLANLKFSQNSRQTLVLLIQMEFSNREKGLAGSNSFLVLQNPPHRSGLASFAFYQSVSVELGHGSRIPSTNPVQPLQAAPEDS